MFNAKHQRDFSIINTSFTDISLCLYIQKFFVRINSNPEHTVKILEIRAKNANKKLPRLSLKSINCYDDNKYGNGGYNVYVSDSDSSSYFGIEGYWYKRITNKLEIDSSFNDFLSTEFKMNLSAKIKSFNSRKFIFYIGEYNPLTIGIKIPPRYILETSVKKEDKKPFVLINVRRKEEIIIHYKEKGIAI